MLVVASLESQGTGEQEITGDPSGIDTLESAERPGKLRQTLHTERKNQEEEEPEHTPREPANRKPVVPDGMGGCEALQKHRNGRDRDEQAEPSQAPAVGIVPTVPGDPEISESE